MTPALAPAALTASAPQPAAAQPATRIHGSVLAAPERRLLLWMATRLPAAATPDRLTALGFLAQCLAGAAYALAPRHPAALGLAALLIAANWWGDSLDGTVARLRRQERPRYGFYVDHLTDVLGSAALMGGLAGSGLVHPAVALAMLVGFLLLAAESFLATHALGRFHLSQGPFGPTEVRVLLIAGTLWAWRRPWCTVAGHRVLLFDLGGGIAAVCMLATLIGTGLRHTRELHRQEPVPALGSTPAPACPEGSLA